MKVMFETYLIGIIGIFIFTILNLPLPWLLGPIVMIVLWKLTLNRETHQPSYFKNGSFITLGIYFGLSFTRETFIVIGPYIVPFAFLTILLLFLCVCHTLLISKWFSIPKTTSILSGIPGGLTEMVAISDSLKGNVGLVTIFQTIRLLTVVLAVPFVVFHLFTPSEIIDIDVSIPVTEERIPIATYFWLLLPIAFALFLRKKIVAAYVVVPLFATAILNVVGVELPLLPNWTVLLAQLAIGVSIGSIIQLRELKIGGRYSLVFFSLTVVTILTAFGLGFVFSILTDVSLDTAMLSFAPGGLIEMVLTAKAIGADASIVSSLQFMRLLIILLLVPPVLKWWLLSKPENRNKELKGITGKSIL
ncbi:AbrB family transcriptional regulator [Bacillus alkalicellulosilyticus]|uniref:AbrB family transcriptional regulator n=1 Tax=Alkalihalobacterium alkalicellulosilyticum TaxID=1912214 RepID=UPI0009962431|nr:AbrB family transcriptional regulator [Bacillus alkalicellulosilyticus]